MSDQGFREVQLSGKQVVFLFMAGAVALIGTFLLGVQAGKGVTAPEALLQATPPPTAAMTDVGPPAPLPPATTPKPGELQYHQTLQGRGEAKPTPVTPSPTPTTAPPASTPAPPPPATNPAPPPSANAVWYVQVDSFSSSANAARRVADLRTKGIAASVFTAPGTGARFKVRVGPLDRRGADAMVTQLRKEGFKPSSPSR